MQIKFLGRVFYFSFIWVLTYLCVLSLLIVLGFWQLGRAEEKTILLENEQLSEAKGIIDFETLINDQTEVLRYRSVSIKGQYEPDHQFLIDNQIVNSRAGYFVFTPFKLERLEKRVLVNRGWIPVNKDRRILPAVSVSNEKKTLQGRINNFPVVGYALAGAEIPTEGWPSVVQLVNENVLSKKLGYQLFSFQIELAPDMQDGYIREWKTKTPMPPEKHIAYAVQWFGLAITLTIIFVWFSRKVND